MHLVLLVPVADFELPSLGGVLCGLFKPEPVNMTSMSVCYGVESGVLTE